jgi:hypothetical protein
MQIFTTFDEVFLMLSNLKFGNFILYLCNNGGISSHFNNDMPSKDVMSTYHIIDKTLKSICVMNEEVT